MAKYCSVCDKKIGFGLASNIVDGIICPSCVNLSANHKSETSEKISDYRHINDERIKRFNKTNVLKSFASSYITIDDNNKMFFYGNKKTIIECAIIYLFDEIEEYGFETVGGQIVTKSKGGLGRAAIGGLLFGGAGAVVGAATSKKETKTVGGINVLKVLINTYSGKKTLIIHDPPQGFIPFLDKCITENQSACSELPFSSADEIAKFKQLLDNGVITQEEFEVKKKQLLGI